MWTFARFAVLAVASAAVTADLAWGKIPNVLILYGLTAAAVLCIGGGRSTEGMWAATASSAAGAAIPLAGGWLLFRFRMIGAGDVKLLAVMGALTGSGKILAFIAVSCFWGALLSLALMLAVTGLRARLLYFRDYVRECISGSGIRPYRSGDASRPENFHFAVPVFMTAALYAAGLI